jgi:hypothetical protein
MDTTELIGPDGIVDPMTGEILDERQIAEQLLAGVGLAGPGGLVVADPCECCCTVISTPTPTPTLSWMPDTILARRGTC